MGPVMVLCHTIPGSYLAGTVRDGGMIFPALLRGHIALETRYYG